MLLLKLLLVVCLPGSNQGECGGPFGRFLPPRKLCCWNRWMRGKPERLLAAAKLARAEGISGACLLSGEDCTLFCRITPPADKMTHKRESRLGSASSIGFGRQCRGTSVRCHRLCCHVGVGCVVAERIAATAIVVGRTGESCLDNGPLARC